MEACPLCGAREPREVLAEAGWLPPEARARLGSDRACPDCAQRALLHLLLERGEASFREVVQEAWPLDPEAAFGAMPTPLRMRAHPDFAGRGVTIAFLDAGFFPHADLVRPANRIRAWADAGREPVLALTFGRDDAPRWPGWNDGRPGQWHGTMTSCAAAGNGFLGRGFYRGLASEAEVVLVEVAEPGDRITDASIARGLRWVRENADSLGIRIVNASLGGDAESPGPDHPVSLEVAALRSAGILVVAAAGNDGVRRLVAPGACVEALTVGGIDDEGRLWHSNWGASKPELVCPSLRVVAPLLPWTPLAAEAGALFAARAAAPPGDPGVASVEARIAETRLVTPHYQHVEGTSFAAPIAASTAACVLEAEPRLGPDELRRMLMEAAVPVPGASPERQGRGALDAGRAVGGALRAGYTSIA